jgi:hypothetical protein
MARATSTVKVTICHWKANVLSFAEFHISRLGPQQKPRGSGARRGSLRNLYANGGDSSFEPVTYPKPNPALLFLRTRVRDLPLLLSVPTRRHWTGRGRPTYAVGATPLAVRTCHDAHQGGS